jgi:hypothetical protein
MALTSGAGARARDGMMTKSMSSPVQPGFANAYTTLPAAAAGALWCDSERADQRERRIIDLVQAR